MRRRPLKHSSWRLQGTLAPEAPPQRSCPVSTRTQTPRPLPPPRRRRGARPNAKGHPAGCSAGAGERRIADAWQPTGRGVSSQWESTRMTRISASRPRITLQAFNCSSGITSASQPRPRFETDVPKSTDCPTLSPVLQCRSLRSAVPPVSIFCPAIDVLYLSQAQAPSTTLSGPRTT